MTIKKYWRRPVVFVLAWYAACPLIVIAIYKSGQFRSGPCTPNLDVMSPVLLFIISVVWFLIALLAAIKRRGIYITAALIHACVLAVAVILFVLLITISTSK